MKERIIDSLIDMAEKTQADTRGGNKKCFINGDYALLQGYIDEEKMQRLMCVGTELKNRGINLARTLDYKVTGDGIGYSLQERAKGVPLHNRVHWKITPEQFVAEQQGYSDRLQTLSEEKQEIFDKFVSDWLEIQKAGRRIDPSKVDNFYYQEGEEITFIDLDGEMSESTQPPMETVCYEIACVLMASSKYYRFTKDEEVKAVINSNISKIFTKFSHSMEKTGMSIEDIKAILSDHFPDIDLSALDERKSESPTSDIIEPNAIVNSTIKSELGTQDINGVTQEIRLDQTKDIQKGQEK